MEIPLWEKENWVPGRLDEWACVDRKAEMHRDYRDEQDASEWENPNKAWGSRGGVKAGREIRCDQVTHLPAPVQFMPARFSFLNLTQRAATKTPYGNFHRRMACRQRMKTKLKKKTHLCHMEDKENGTTHTE